MSNMLTEVRLLAVPLENDYKHTLHFDSINAQTEYFSGRVVYSATDCSYQRKDRIIRFPKDIDNLNTVNYVMYRNTYPNGAFTNWHYAFIVKMEYKNEGLTNIYIETDVMQEYLRTIHYIIRPSFVEREHVSKTNDMAGANTVPEGLDTGEYICQGDIVCDDLQEKSLVLGCTLDINSYTNQASDWNTTKEFAPAYGSNYNGLYSGLKYFVITPSQLQTIMKHIAYEGQEDAVHTLFYAPTKCLSTLTTGTYATDIASSDVVKNLSWLVGSKPTNLDGYTPRNKKLLTAPYCYLMVDNGGGVAVEYMYEKFSEDSIIFQILSVLTTGMSIRAVPQYYNGVANNNSEGINLSKLATCSWVSDAYTSWLTQSAVNVGLSTAGAIATTVGSIALAGATGGGSLVVGASIAGGVASVGASIMSANERISTPPQLHGNTNNGDVATANGDVVFRAYKMCVRKEYAKIIDDYFSVYGYKINRVKVPNINHRQNYWYIKTIDVNLDGNIPVEDMKKIKECYNNGITFWVNPSYIGRYEIDGEWIEN